MFDPNYCPLCVSLGDSQCNLKGESCNHDFNKGDKSDEEKSVNPYFLPLSHSQGSSLQPAEGMLTLLLYLDVCLQPPGALGGGL